MRANELYGRLYAIYKLANPKAREYILDVGCSSGHLLKHFENENIVIGVDIHRFEEWKQIKRRCKNIDFILASATHLPFTCNSFDKIVMAELLEHVNDPTSVLKETYRVLKNGGKIIISTPNKGILPLNYFLDPAYWFFKRHKHFSFNELQHYLVRARFKPVILFTGGLIAEQLAYYILSLRAFLKFGLKSFKGIAASLSSSAPYLLKKAATFEFIKGYMRQKVNYYCLICIAKKEK